MKTQIIYINLPHRVLDTFFNDLTQNRGLGHDDFLYIECGGDYGSQEYVEFHAKTQDALDALLDYEKDFNEYEKSVEFV